MLAGSPTTAKISAQLTNAAAWKGFIEHLNEKLEAQRSETARISAECEDCAAAYAKLDAARTLLETKVESLNNDIETLEQHKTKNEQGIELLRQELNEIRNGYQHKLDDLRGKIRGLLQGELTRWLQTALDAVQSEPPWIQAVQERLEESLKLIQKEAQWLQRSG